MPLIMVLAAVVCAVLLWLAGTVASFRAAGIPVAPPAYVLRLGPPPTVLQLDPAPGASRSTTIFVCDLAESTWVANTITGARNGEVHAVSNRVMAEINALFEEASRNDPWVTDTLPPDFGPPPMWTIRAFDHGNAGAATQRKTRRASAGAIGRETHRTDARMSGNGGDPEVRRMAGAMYAIGMTLESEEKGNICATPPGWPADDGERRRILLADDGIASGKPAGRRFYLDLWFHHPDQRNSSWCMSFTDDPRWPRTDNPPTLVSVDRMRPLFAAALIAPDVLRTEAPAAETRQPVNTWGEVRILVHASNSESPRMVYDMKFSTGETRVVARAIADALASTRPDLARQLRDVAHDFPDHDDPRGFWGD